MGPWLDEMYQALCQTIGSKMEQQRYSVCGDREWTVSSVLASCAGGKWSWRTLCSELNELLSLFSIPSFLFISFSKWCPVDPHIKEVGLEPELLYFGLPCLSPS